MHGNQTWNPVRPTMFIENRPHIVFTGWVYKKMKLDMPCKSATNKWRTLRRCLTCLISSFFHGRVKSFSPEFHNTCLVFRNFRSNSNNHHMLDGDSKVLITMETWRGEIVVVRVWILGNMIPELLLLTVPVFILFGMPYLPKFKRFTIAIVKQQRISRPDVWMLFDLSSSQNIVTLLLFLLDSDYRILQLVARALRTATASFGSCVSFLFKWLFHVVHLHGRRLWFWLLKI